MPRTRHIGTTRFVVTGKYLKIGDKRWAKGAEFTVPKGGTGVPRGGIDVERLIKGGVIKEAGRG